MGDRAYCFVVLVFCLFGRILFILFGQLSEEQEGECGEEDYAAKLGKRSTCNFVITLG